jgi:coenzyme F420-reducing hydrogenase delta subunit
MMIINYWCYVKSGTQMDHEHTNKNTYESSVKSTIINVVMRVNCEFISDKFKHIMM